MAQRYGRQANGVMARHYGQGHAFADQHRDATPRFCYLYDHDHLGGFMFNSDQLLFHEVQYSDYLPGQLISQTMPASATMHEGMASQPVSMSATLHGADEAVHPQLSKAGRWL